MKNIKDAFKINYSVVMLLSRMNDTNADDAITDRKRERSLISIPSLLIFRIWFFTSRSSP